MTSERQVIKHDPFVTPMVLIVQNGMKSITYIYYIKQLLTYASIDMIVGHPEPEKNSVGIFEYILASMLKVYLDVF